MKFNRALPTISAVLISAGCVRTAPPAPEPMRAPVTLITPVTMISNGDEALSPMIAQQGASQPTTAQPGGPSNTAGAASAPTTPAAADATSAGPSWDIDVRSYESTDRVEHYVHLFSGPAKERIESWLQRGTRYEPMIRAQLRAGGLPEDMYYLALIESGFDPNAYSRAAAVGMWQFMTSTARDMGLRVDWWVDERRDPMKSTTAAVRFIKQLNEQFGSLYLAAAAYNGGPGRIARGLSRYADDLEGTAGDDLFFALAEKDYLRNETREYVPQLIAAALVAKEPDRYGMTVTPLDPIAYDSVDVGPATPLAAVARAAGVQVGAVLGLNPHILRGLTPPRDSFFVRVPVGSDSGFDAAFAALPKSERTGLDRVESTKGESVASIAKKTGSTIKAINLYNPNLKRLKSGNLVAGQLVLVPSEAVAAAATSAPDPSIERYSKSLTATTHVVKSGETLGAIALKYHTSTDALMSLNGLKTTRILAGQALLVKGSATSTIKKKAGPKSSGARPRS